MAKWARKNDEGQIIEIIDFDPTDKFHASIVWEKVKDSDDVDDVNDLTPETNPAIAIEEKRVEAELAALTKPVEE